MRVMGVDPGSNITGYGIIETDGRRYEVVEYAAIRTPSKSRFPDRLLSSAESLKK